MSIVDSEIGLSRLKAIQDKAGKFLQKKLESGSCGNVSQLVEGLIYSGKLATVIGLLDSIMAEQIVDNKLDLLNSNNFCLVIGKNEANTNSFCGIVTSVDFGERKVKLVGFSGFFANLSSMTYDSSMLFKEVKWEVVDLS